MPLPLDASVSSLGRLGVRCAKTLKALGVVDVGGLLRHLPSRYEDYRRQARLDGPTDGPATLHVRVDMIRGRRSAKTKMLLTEATVSDESGTAKVVWFRQPFITKLFRPGDRVFLSGRVEHRPWGLEIVNPVYEKATTSSIHTGRLVPVYPLSGSLTVKQLRALLHAALPSAELVAETLPSALLDTYDLPGLKEAIRGIHFPSSMAEAESADRRFRFEELFMLQLKGAWARKERKRRSGVPIPFMEPAVKAFVAGLPFRLTDDQKKVSWRILQEMSSGVPMQRLVEGDVGSGKTAVAALAMHNAAAAGFSSLLMAPTEILAEQHFRTVSKMTFGQPYPVILRTRTNRNRVDAGGPAIVIGTQALLGEGVRPPKVGLIVVDEQHRFGVGQRQLLTARLAGIDGELPHFLSMTATPIPRSLALALFGDVEFSALRQMPPGRKPVRTLLIADRDRPRMLAEIRGELEAGHRVFIVCPLIEASDTYGVRSVEDEIIRLRTEAFPDFEILALHGRMKGDEKRRIMGRFAEGPAAVLVSTTVVEVGVDVSSATIMLIEGAERFGIAQLHQLRGRVGRSDLLSTCYLATSSDASAARERLQAFVQAKDCFDLAELDLRLRGPGSLFGEAQSGFAELRRFRPGDTRLIEETKEAASRLLEEDPDLSRHPDVKKKISAEAEKVHLE